MSLKTKKGAGEIVQCSKAGCPFRGPRFNLLNPHGGSEPFITSVPGGLAPSSDPHRHWARIWCTNIPSGKKLTLYEADSVLRLSYSFPFPSQVLALRACAVPCGNHEALSLAEPDK